MYYRGKIEQSQQQQVQKWVFPDEPSQFYRALIMPSRRYEKGAYHQ